MMAIGVIAALQNEDFKQDRIVFTPPMECLPVNGFPESPDWTYELKPDGFRGQAIRDNRGVHLLSSISPVLSASSFLRYGNWAGRELSLSALALAMSPASGVAHG